MAGRSAPEGPDLPRDIPLGAPVGQIGPTPECTVDLVIVPRLRDRLLFALVILITVGLWALVPDAEAQADPEAGSPLAQLTFGLLYVGAFLGIFVERKLSLKLMRTALPLMLLLLVAVLSSLWSEDPWPTVRRSLSLLGSSALALYFVRRLGIKGFAHTFANTATLIAFLSVILIIFYPIIGVMPDDGAWRGLFIHKNGLGQFACVALLTLACVRDTSRGPRNSFRTFAFLLFLVLLIGSRSSSSEIISVVLAIVAAVALWSRAARSLKPAVFTLLAVSAASLIAIMSGFSVDDALALLGKDATLTGRTDLWAGLIDAVGERPLLGYGYQAFFTPNAGMARYVAMVDAPHAHNGYLGIALGLGVVGLIALALALATGLAHAWRLFWYNHDRLAIWPFLVILYTILADFTEDHFQQASVLWFLFVAAFLFASHAAWRCPRPEQSQATRCLSGTRSGRAVNGLAN